MALWGTAVPYINAAGAKSSSPPPPQLTFSPRFQSRRLLGSSPGTHYYGVLRYLVEQFGALSLLTTGYRAATRAAAGAFMRITWTARCRRSSASSRTSSNCAPLCVAAIGGPVGAALRRCGGVQWMWRKQAQRHDRQLDRLDGEARCAVSAPLRHRAWVAGGDGTVGYCSTIY